MVQLESAVILFGSIIVSGLILVSMYCRELFRVYKLSSNIPGPRPVPFLGNIHEFKGTREEMVRRGLSLFSSYSPMCRVWMGPILLIGTDDPEYVKMMLVQSRMMERPYLRKLLWPVLGDGLITVPEHRWPARRKLVGYAMNSMILQNYVPIFVAQSETLVERLRIHDNGAQFDIRNYYSGCMFDIVSETSMGVRVDQQSKDRCEFDEIVSSISMIATDRFVKPWLHPELIFNLTAQGDEYRKNVELLRELIEDVIRKKKAKMTKNPEQVLEVISENEVESSKSKQKSLLNSLLENTGDDSQLTDKILVDEVVTMYIAGVETTSATLTFATVMLASHPNIQEDVYEELREIYGDDERPIIFEDLGKMVKLERVLKETLRLFPTVSAIPRVAREDTKLGEYVIPKGATMIAPPIGVHRNEKVWPEPFKFDPDRFLPEEVAKRHPYAYIPFGGGPRNCVGSKYAMMALKVVCATLLRKYVIKKDDAVSVIEVPLNPGVTLTPGEKNDVRIERRTRV